MQQWIAAVVVVLAAALLARRAWKLVRARRKGCATGCGKCSGCGD